ncbi:MAG: glucuronate isomerase [Bacteroidales bacterium]|nr:glucuronate isomerase [Bacteroidales bacterium]
MDWAGKDFLLNNDFARELFHDHAAGLPIIDYHNHLDPVAIAEDRRYADLGELWVRTDPYKHRAMRINGVPEHIVSGNASDREKFDAWAATCPMTLGNPLYHWSAMELRKVFGIDECLTPSSAGMIWDRSAALLKEKDFSTVGILDKWNIETLCTSDDLLDSLEPHVAATQGAGSFKVLPSLRADSVLAFGTPSHQAWTRRLGKVNGLDDYLALINERLDVFSASGCRVADHALDNGFRFSIPSKDEAQGIFRKCLSGDHVPSDDIVRLKSYVLAFLAGEYSRRGWRMLLHVGAQRFTSSRLRALAGPAGGYATIGSPCDMESLCSFLDHTEKVHGLPKTVIFTLNPADNAAFAVTTGSYSEDGVWGKVQFGPAWWYNDHKEGIESHLRAVSSYGLLGRFVGMTTDSRSILSFSRHEYFRRLVCNYLGEMVEKGEAPADMEYIAGIASGIAYGNSKEWFNL